jgi:hypothetical protein
MLLEAERLTRQEKTARLREQRLAATSAAKTLSPAKKPTRPKPPMKKRKATDVS